MEEGEKASTLETLDQRPYATWTVTARV